MVYLVAIFRQIQGLNDLPTAPRTSVPLKAIADNASKPPAAERHPQGMGRIRYQTKVSYPICEPWCWNLSTFARTKSPSFVGKYTIHGAYGYSKWQLNDYSDKTDGLKPWWNRPDDLAEHLHLPYKHGQLGYLQNPWKGQSQKILAEL